MSALGSILSTNEVRAVLFTQTANATVANTVAETTIIGSGVGSLTLPANFLTVGRTIHFRLWGIYSTDAAAPTLNVNVKLGGTTIMTTTAIAATAAMTNRGLTIHGMITCRTTGATGTVFGQGQCEQNNANTNSQARDMENTATVTVDTTAALTFDITVTWGTANANNTATGTNLVLEG